MKKYEERYKRLLGVDAAYIREDDIIILGCPEDGDDEKHNCDEMGCGGLDHVLLRGQFRFMQKGYNEATQEAGEGEAE